MWTLTMRKPSIWMLSLVVCLCVPRAHGDAIWFQLASTSLTTTVGGTVTFEGTVTNNSGGDLQASDFFLNFFGFDPASVTPVQDLGVATDFLIPNATTSAQVSLFDVALAATATGSTFPIQVQLEDANGDLSAIQTATVSLTPSAPVPEPASLFLTITGALAAIAMRRRNS